LLEAGAGVCGEKAPNAAEGALKLRSILRPSEGTMLAGKCKLFARLLFTRIDRECSTVHSGDMWWRERSRREAPPYRQVGAGM